VISEQLLTTTDADEWRTILPARTSVFGSVEYARIVETHNGYQARLYVRDTGDEQVAYPFFLRPIRALPFAQGLQDEWWDSLTPEYTGPLQVNGGTHTSVSDFQTRFSAYCRDQNIVTEFAHLHPWHWQPDLLQADLISLDREIVYVDLTWPADRLWDDSYLYACRKNINRARREGVRVFQATTADHIREFSRIYIDTMARNDAPGQYFFPPTYFEAFFENMPDHACFMLAEHRGRVIAGTLYLHDNTDVYSYLGGADQEFQQIRPTNAVVHETIRWAQGAGKQRLILGGGYHLDDGIFRFKSSFSPLRARFHVYRRIHLPEQYKRLCSAWSSYYQSKTSANNYFPAYRSQPVSVSTLT
jgi:serine/alanine adding enzyme